MTNTVVVLEWVLIAGLLLVTGGIVLVSRSSAAEQRQQSQTLRGSGVTLALLAAVCWAISMVLVTPGIEGLDSAMAGSVRMPALSLMLWGTVATRRTFGQFTRLSVGDWALIIAGGFVGMGLGSLLFLRTVSMVGPTKAAILTSTSPLFALPLCVVFLKESINWSVIVGSALTVAGVVLVSLP